MKVPVGIDKLTAFCYRPVARLGVSVAFKLMVPFAIVITVVSIAIGISACWEVSASLHSAMLRQSRILTDSLIGAIRDPLTTGESEQIRHIFESAQAADPELTYLELITSEGQILASTKPGFHAADHVSRAELQKLEVKGYTVRPSGPNSFLVLAPAVAQNGDRSIMRMEFSQKIVESTISTIEFRIAIIALMTLVAEVFFDAITIYGLIIRPLSIVGAAAKSVACGDVVERIHIDNGDEIGRLKDSVNELIVYFDEMAFVAKSISQGDLSIEVRARSTSDIFGNAFIEMVESLKTMITKLVSSARYLKEASSELATSSGEQSDLAARQSAALNEWLETLKDVNAIVETASNSAQSVMGISKESLAFSNEGLSNLEQATMSMERILTQVQDISKNITDLGVDAAQIGDITASVEEIAIQSEVLTVNGALEAVRAGDAGRGFGALAKEIKFLSVQSRSATAQVRDSLTKIRNSAGATVKVMDEGIRRVQIGKTHMHHVGSTFNSLYQTIINSVQAATEISKATERQAEQILSMTEAVKSLADGAAESAIASERHSDTAKELNTVAENINAIVRHFDVGVQK